MVNFLRKVVLSSDLEVAIFARGIRKMNEISEMELLFNYQLSDGLLM